VTPVSEAEADAYFATRPKQAQIGAWASKQIAAAWRAGSRSSRRSQGRRQAHCRRGAAATGLERLADRTQRFEFWHDRPFRLHDRIEFGRETSDQPWSRTRLYPCISRV